MGFGQPRMPILGLLGDWFDKTISYPGRPHKDLRCRLRFEKPSALIAVSNLAGGSDLFQPRLIGSRSFLIEYLKPSPTDDHRHNYDHRHEVRRRFPTASGFPNGLKRGRRAATPTPR